MNKKIEETSQMLNFLSRKFNNLDMQIMQMQGLMQQLTGSYLNNINPSTMTSNYRETTGSENNQLDPNILR